MKRDMDLVRKLLFAIEGFEGEPDYRQLRIDGYEPEQIEHHLILMKDAGLLLGPPPVGFEIGRAHV